MRSCSGHQFAAEHLHAALVQGVVAVVESDHGGRVSVMPGAQLCTHKGRGTHPMAGLSEPTRSRGAQRELPQRGLESLHLLVKVFGGRSCFLHQGGILLGDRIHLGHGVTDLPDASRLFL
jgi:hypothetical protein